MNRLFNLLRRLIPAILIALAAFSSLGADEPVVAAILLPSVVQVDSTGFHLDDLLPANPSAGAPPHVKLAASPASGQALVFSRAQLTELIQRSAPDFANTSFSGPTQVRVTRRVRLLEETELRALLTTRLQEDSVRDKGELDLRFSRPWKAVSVPDEPLTLILLDLPATGLSPNSIIRFEITAGRETAGQWQVSIQSRVLREIPVAQTALKRGQPLRESDFSMEKRDILTLREPLTATALADASLELADNVVPGQALVARSVRIRPLILRGRIVDGVVQEGALNISLKVEALEDGLPGQTVRVRNPKTKREFQGKVQNEQTILLYL